MELFNWGLIGPGSIAQRFAAAVQAMPECRLHSVYGRRPAQAATFAAQWQQPGDVPIRVAGDLAQLLADPDVHAIYVATPHDSHAYYSTACLLQGKPVLCEKPMTPGLETTRALVALARSRRVFLMEALWTRFLPVYGQIALWLEAQAIGRLQHIQSSFCFPAPFDEGSRLYDPARAGGALLDIGIYNLAMTRWALQASLGCCPEPTHVQAQAVFAPSGVDQRVSGTLRFPSDVSAHFVCALDGEAPNSLVLCGSAGVITVPSSFWAGEVAELQCGRQPTTRVEAPFDINGFEGEIAEAMDCVRHGRTESAVMPLDETLALSAWLEKVENMIAMPDRATDTRR